LSTRPSRKELTLIAPELLFAEAANALWVICRRGVITKDDYAEAIGVLKAAPVSTPVPMRQLAASAALARELNRPVYDCFYLALAMQEQLPVVTADQRFFSTVRKHSFLSDQVVHVESL
jgi:predicted nucleic acid-binding protein